LVGDGRVRSKRASLLERSLCASPGARGATRPTLASFVANAQFWLSGDVWFKLFGVGRHFRRVGRVGLKGRDSAGGADEEFAVGGALRRIRGRLSIFGVASFHFRSVLRTVRQPRTAFDAFAEAVAFGRAASFAKLADKKRRSCHRERNRKAPKHGAHVNGLWRGNGGIGIAHLGPSDGRRLLITKFGVWAPKKAGFQRTRSASFPFFDGADGEVRDAVG